jgi:uncharacterized protein YukE
MSQQVVVNPEDILKFRAHLKNYTEELKNKSSSLRGQFKQLGETWRDQEHAKFSQEFEQVMKTIQKFLEATNQYIPFLERKAKAAKEYLEKR